jgi:hypothetical protein
MDLTQGESNAAFTPEIKQIWIEEASTAKSEAVAERLRVSNYSPRSKVGSILWCIVCCRPDLMHSIKNPSQYLTKPGDMVVNTLERIGRYMLGTMDEGLRLQGYPGPVVQHVTSDADDAGGVHRRSMLCYMQWIGPPLGDESTLVPRAFFQWNSAWSIPVASGSMESEIYAGLQWIGPPLGDESTLVPRAFFQWNSAWSIPVASGSMESRDAESRAHRRNRAARRQGDQPVGGQLIEQDDAAGRARREEFDRYQAHRPAHYGRSPGDRY